MELKRFLVPCRKLQIPFQRRYISSGLVSHFASRDPIQNTDKIRMQFNRSNQSNQSTDIQQTQDQKPIKLTRREKIERINLQSHTKLYYIDDKFKIFNENVTKVVDLGCVPGNWSQFAKNRLCEVHGLEEEDFKKKCSLLGVDILFGTPSRGTSYIQGNLYSKLTHYNIIHHFKELAVRQRLPNVYSNKDQEADNNSYLAKEQDQSFYSQLDELTLDMENLSLEDQRLKFMSNLTPEDYQPDLVLSDLSAPFLQDQGFFNNTNTRPYIRTGTNEGLKKIIVEPMKTSIDLADSCLLLCCSLLKREGNLILRLSVVDLNDPELKLLQNRLEKVFQSVIRWTKNNFDCTHHSKEETPVPEINELFFICHNKFEHIADIYDVFIPDSMKNNALGDKLSQGSSD